MSRLRSCALGLVVVLAACSQEPEAEQLPPLAPVEVRVAEVRRGDIAAALRVPGETAAFDVLRLGSPVSGRISALAVRAGDLVAKGQVVARVLPAESEAALNGFVVLEQAGRLNGEDQHQAHRLSDDLRRHDISLRAPFAGIVADRQRNPGEQVAANDILLEIFDPRSLHVVAQVPVDIAPSLRTGTPAEVTLGGEILAGRVDAVLTAVTPQALTLPVRIVLGSPLHHPLLGAAVRCRIFTARHEGALLIPPSALVSSNADGVGTVLVAGGDRATRRAVRVGLQTPESVEILDGLVEGEIVLVGDQYGLSESAPIVARPM